MTTAGWIFMCVALAFVWGLAATCYRRVLTTPAEEKVPVGFGP